MISGIRRADRELDVAARAVERRGESLSEANAAAEVRRQTVTEGKPPLLSLASGLHSSRDASDIRC